MPSTLLRFVAVSFLLSTSFLWATPILAGSHVELILDASGSMWNRLDDGRFRITAAKEALDGFIDGLPEENMEVGLRIYGASVKAGEPGACEDSRLVVPLQGVDKSALRSAVKDAQALGSTPIALSLKKAAADFPADATDKLIVLVTDGEEACGGDVRAAIEGLKGIDLRIIGFDLDPDDARVFKQLGAFENAADAKALAGALGRAVADRVPPLGEATLKAPEEVAASTSFEVHWSGEANPQDYITLVPATAKDGTYKDWEWVKDGNPLTFLAPLKPGDYELRYQSDRVPGVAARRAVKVTPVKFAVSPPTKIQAGTVFEVPWQGPNGAGDYLTIVKKGSPAGAYMSYFYTRDGSPATLSAPLEVGEFEVRYQSENEEGIFASVVVELVPVEVVLEAPASVAAGSTFEVRWSGPGNDQDWITIVKVEAKDGAYLSYGYARDGSPTTLTAPDEPGAYEIRYASDRVRGTFARRPIRVE